MSCVLYVWFGARVEVQLCATSGANAYCVDRHSSMSSLAAKGTINRKDFKCWGQMPKVNTPEYAAWFKEVRRFGAALSMPR